MNLTTLHVRNLRCLEDVTVSFGGLTVLLGANSAGKSSLLKALRFFFDGDALEADDVYGRQHRTISVRASFGELSPSDRAAFGKYALGDSMVLTKSWSGGDVKLTGRGIRFPAFEPIRAATGRDVARLYKELRETQAHLELPQATTKDSVLQATLTWEMQHSELCEVSEGEDASSLFGYSNVGQNKLSERFKFVFVPGLRDASTEAVEKRGSLLTQLLTAIAEQRAQANQQLAAIEDDARRRYSAAVEESHGPTLQGLAARLTAQMRRYVPTADVVLDPVAAEIKVSEPTVELRAGEAHDLTDIGRQGHGFQRTFIIAALEYLAETSSSEGNGDAPTLCLGIEEPELYQHPPRARHFAKTLRGLGDDPSVQVCFATHSPYFVAPEDFGSLRLFRRNVDRGESMPPAVTVTEGNIEEVIPRLSERQQSQPARYLARTLSETFREAFFSKLVLLVEGPTDAAVFRQVAALTGRDLISQGVSCIDVRKGSQPIALAILQALKIPTYVVFDGDADAVDRDACPECGRTVTNRATAMRGNRAIMQALGVPPADFPDSVVEEQWACFSRTLEGEVEDLAKDARRVSDEFGWGPKSPEAYAEAVSQMGHEALPPMLGRVIDVVLDKAGAVASESDA